MIPTSNFLQAFYRWIVENHKTPILVLNTKNLHYQFLSDFIKNNEIAFDISPPAIRDLKFENDITDYKNIIPFPKITN